jgi:siroheme synthase-like protein
VASSQTDAFPVALNLRGRNVLVIGGGDEAVQKVPRLLAAGARVTLVAETVDATLSQLARARELGWFARAFTASDVHGAHVVMLTEPCPASAIALRALQAHHPFWLCAIDQPDHADFFLVSVVTSGPVQIAISTSGRAPLLARHLRRALTRGLGPRFGEFARSFAALRARLRALPKGQRTELLERALDGFAMEVHVRYPEGDGQGTDYPPEPARG